MKMLKLKIRLCGLIALSKIQSLGRNEDQPTNAHATRTNVSEGQGRIKPSQTANRLRLINSSQLLLLWK